MRGSVATEARSLRSVTGGTRLYLVMADPVGTLGSPALYNSLFEVTGIDAVMLPWAVAADDLDAAWGGLQAVKNLGGMVISMPHKVKMLRHLQVLEPRARLAGAVNVACRMGSSWGGGMFDGVGVIHALRAQGWRGEGTSALLIGCGGAGRAIAYAVAQEGIGRLALADLDALKAKQLAQEVRDACGKLDCQPVAQAEGPYDLIVNASPPAKPHAATDLVGDRPFAPNTFVVDIASGRIPSALIERGRLAGCAIVTSREAILGQVRPIWDFFGLPALTPAQLAAGIQRYEG